MNDESGWKKYWSDGHTPRGPKDLKPMMFWSRELRPENCVDETIPKSCRDRAVAILTEGEVVSQMRGFAGCRICGERLGTADMQALGFVYPQKAEHYILEHNVWVPELKEMLEADDIEYFKRKITSALKIPPEFLGSGIYRTAEIMVKLDGEERMNALRDLAIESITSVEALVAALEAAPQQQTKGQN